MAEELNNVVTEETTEEVTTVTCILDDEHTLDIIDGEEYENQPHETIVKFCELQSEGIIPDITFDNYSTTDKYGRPLTWDITVGELNIYIVNTYLKKTKKNWALKSQSFKLNKNV